MRLGSAEIHGALLVAALVAAWASWKADDTPAEKPGEVAIWDLGRAATITKVAYVAEGRSVVLEQRGAGETGHIWATTQREKKARKEKKDEPAASQPTSQPATPAADAGPSAAADAGPKAEPEPEPEAPPEIDEKQFRANKKATEVFASLIRPVAKRALGSLDAAQIEEVQLKEPEATIEITASSGATKHLEVGMLAYGGGLRYVRDPDAGVTYVVEAKLVDDLKWGDSRLVERDLHAFKLKDLTAFAIKAGERSREFARTGDADASKPQWRAPETPEGEVDETAATWLGKLWRLRADRYVKDGEDVTKQGETTNAEVKVLRIDFQAKDGQSGHLELSRYGEGKDAKFYGRTEHTQSLVNVSRYQADEVEKDLEAVLKP